jgi:hypothetical protein
MSADSGLRPNNDRIAAMVLQYEVERFYYDEAALLDAHRYEEWLALFSDDAHYFMPIRRTRMQRELNKEFTQPGEMPSSMTTRLCSPEGWRSSIRGAHGRKIHPRARVI